MRTYVINLLGGSGIGKSTAACKVFAELKDRGLLAELVVEYVKEWAWSGRSVGPYGQSIIYGRQLERETRLYGKAEFIVTDSPLLLCPVYQKHYNGHESLKTSVFQDLATAAASDVVHMNFLLKRSKPFDPKGRFEDEKTAKLIDRKVKAFLVYHGINYIPVDVPDEDRVKFITETVMNRLQGEDND